MAKINTTCYPRLLAHDPRLPRKFRHPDDNKALDATIIATKRERWRTEVNVPPTRVYQAIGDVPGGGAETGEVTQPSNSVIQWNRVTKRWEYASYSPNPTPVNRVARIVRGNSANLHRGGNF